MDPILKILDVQLLLFQMSRSDHSDYLHIQSNKYICCAAVTFSTYETAVWM